MHDATAAAIHWVEQGHVPDAVVRLGIRRFLKARLSDLAGRDPEAEAALTQAFVENMAAAPMALDTDKANRQHYELPAAFFGAVLGPRRKYSSCAWTRGVTTLAAAEEAALSKTCERAGIADGQRILELGCGWGSLTLWIAERHPRSTIVALSNSRSQREYILEQAAQRGLDNVRVVTAEFSAFDIDERFDRILSVEMFEHLRNWPLAFRNVARWLRDDGRFFLHVFAHRGAPYAFEERDASDWMSRHFFSGGIMPADDLALRCQDHLRLEQRWRWSGSHYERTARAWLANLDAARIELAPLMDATYGADAALWWMRWRLFFMSVEELFGHDGGQQWWVGHYLFSRR